MELLLIILVIAAIGFFVVNSRRSSAARDAQSLDDAKADARQAIERLGGQVYNLIGSNDAAKQALADASERQIAAGSQIDLARTPAQARLAKQTALEGLYYIRGARIAMGMDPVPRSRRSTARAPPGPSPRTARSTSRAAGSRHRRTRPRTPRTTTPAVESPDVRFRPAGIPNRGGSPR